MQTAEIKSTVTENENHTFCWFSCLTLLCLFSLKPVFALFNFTDSLQSEIKLFVKLVEATTNQTTRLHTLYQMHCSFFLRTAVILRPQSTWVTATKQKGKELLPTEYSRTSRCQTWNSASFSYFPLIIPFSLLFTLKWWWLWQCLTMRTKSAAVLLITVQCCL